MPSKSSQERRESHEEFMRWLREQEQKRRWCRCPGPLWVRRYLGQKLCLRCSKLEAPRAGRSRAGSRPPVHRNPRRR